MFPIALNSDNTLNRRRVPIIFFPGIMGSRIRFTSSDTAWDPDSKATMLWDHVLTSTSAQRERMHFREPGEILEDDPKIKLTKTETARGWAGLYSPSYIPFLRWLVQKTQGPFDLPVYAVPYDWRQDVGRLAAYGSNRVQEILQDAPEPSSQFILVTHSMGGLVTRRMLKEFDGVAASCAGVIHVVQPADGAAVLYRRFFTGNISGVDGHGVAGLVLTKILGDTARKGHKLASVLPGAMQLLPGPNYYTQYDPIPWLTFSTPDKPEVDKKWVAPIHDLYRAEVSPPGVMPGPNELDEDMKAIRNDMMERVAEVEAFHKALGTYTHPRTFAVYSTGLQGESQVHFRLDKDPNGTWEEVPGPPCAPSGKPWIGTQKKPKDEWRGAMLRRSPHSDETVPEASGAGLFREPSPHQASHPDDAALSEARQFQVTGVGHEPAFSDGTVRELVLRLVHRALREA